jgi:hypothetical protein
VILQDVSAAGAKCGLATERSEVVDALAGLIENGLAKAYILTATEREPFSGELQGMPPMEVIEEDYKTYFYITTKGMDVHLSDDAWWPIDEEGQPR